MKLTRSIERIIEKSLANEALEEGELAQLCAIETFSPEYYAAAWAAHKIISEASDGIAEVHAQIGIDANPCSKNCIWCSFAEINEARSGSMEMSVEKIVEYAKSYIEAEANCLTVMITADYDFDTYLEVLRAIRAAIGSEMPITANLGDFDYAMALKLKETGVTSVYHAFRMGEGSCNTIPLQTRIDTIKAAQKASLKVMNCVEMIGPEWPVADVVEMMMCSLALKPDYGNAWTRVAVPGTKMAEFEHFSSARACVFSYAYRLAAGRSMRFGGSNLGWAEVGTNPRDDKNATEIDGLGSSVDKVREGFLQQEWKVARTPSHYW